MAIMWGVIVFGDWLDAIALLGILLIVASGLYASWCENVRGVGVASGVEQARIQRLASRLGLDPFLDRDPDGLSQGEKRRVQVLLALMKRAALYVFDEPLSNLV